MDTLKDTRRYRRWTMRLPAGFAAGLAASAVLILLVVAGILRLLGHPVAATAISDATTASTSSTDEASQGFLYGRVTTEDGVAYQGRLRFGRNEEAFWGDYFNGSKAENPWTSHALAGQPGQTGRNAAGDLAAGNGGLLIFVEGRERPEYVQWTDIEQIDFRRPWAMYPPLAARLPLQ